MLGELSMAHFGIIAFAIAHFTQTGIILILIHKNDKLKKAQIK
jgi:hypothetical protein